MTLHAVVMAGGSGTRFWPASRSARPKQLLPLCDGTPLIRATVERVAGLCGPEATWIVTNPVQLQGVQQAVPDFPSDRILVEPEPRDTAPCIALAAARIEAESPGAIMAVMPSDHVIRPVAVFQARLRRAAAVASDGETLVTFGIRPDRPATTYGYIEPGPPLDAAEPDVRRVERFREKPAREIAERYVASGSFLWNSGIFVWSTRAIFAAMDVGAKELATCARDMLDAARRGDQPALLAAFRRTPRISIDFAVMEHAPRVAVLEAGFEWHDLGSFLTLHSVAPADAAGNVAVLAGGANWSAVDSERCVVYGEGQRTVTLLGARDLLVVAVDDAVLVCPKERADDLKQLIAQLRREGRTDLL